MAYEINHIHIKSSDPESIAKWYVKAFGFKIAGDEVRVFGDRFIKCESSNGMVVNISAERTNEMLNEGDPYAHYGLEHFGITVKGIDSEIDRLIELGAELLEGPIPINNGVIESIAFIKAPGDTRIELIEFS
ncbi:MAG: hypothetical protein CL758_06220 [Chloroflexi bacterium]|nr:hypothetical protein [Chloroflexota bacterium]|tara:strand:+ start:442 stop:837 length:396 start_codon:yes stop_codon:yes gene_type:complete